MAAENVILFSLVFPLLALLLVAFLRTSKGPDSSQSSSVSMAGVVVGIVAMVAAAVAVRERGAKKRQKLRGVPVELGADPEGVTYRNQRFLSLVEDCDGAVTIPALFEQACGKFAQHPLLGSRSLVSREMETGPDGRAFEKLHLGGYVWLTYRQVFQRVSNFASGLVAIGHGKGERVAIFAETRAEWFIAANACFRRNAAVVTIYASLGEEALAYSLNETEVTTVVCDGKQLEKVLHMSGQLNTIRRVVYMDDEKDGKVPSLSGRAASWTVEPFSKVEALGQQAPVEPDLPSHSDIAVIMYTSGSTGMPKGVMMTHRNIVSTIGGISFLVPGLGPSDIYIAYLPLAHVMELAAELTLSASGGAIGYGSPLTLTDTASKIKKGTKGDASQLHPTLMTAVPAILDRVRDGVRKQVDAKGGVAKALFNFAYNRRLAAVEGSWLGAWGLEKALWEALVFKKIRAVLGGRVRGMLSGGAPLSRDTQRFINVTFGAPIGQGYGLTETCSGGTFSEWDDTTVGRVGPPVPHAYIKLVDWEEGGYLASDKPMPRGEIVIGGPSVTLGYFKNQVKTDEVYKVDSRGLRWFYTGDIGRFHPDGCLEIVDRKKDIVKLQHGEYVSLGKVEAVLAASPYVENIMVHADPFHSYAVALVVAGHAALEDWAKKVGVTFQDLTELCKSKEAVQEVIKSISQIGKEAKLQKFEVPAKIKLLPDAWTADTGLVTAALKLKRESIKKAFANDLHALYA